MLRGALLLPLDATFDTPPTAPSPPLRGFVPHEKNRLPLLWPLDAFTAVADALGGRRVVAVDRSGPGGRRTGGGRRLLPCPSFRPPACVAISLAGGGRRQDQPDRDRNRGHRHALREPALHGRGRRRRGSDRGRAAATRDQPGLAGAGDRWLALFRLPAGRRQKRRRHGPAACGDVPRHAARRGFRAAEPAADVSKSAWPAAPRALFGGLA